jgi:hypothetical protein
METSYEFDHYDYEGQPWHESTHMRFTLTSTGLDVAIETAIRESYLKLPTDKFPDFNEFFGFPSPHDIITTIKQLHESGRTREVQQAIGELGKVEFSWIGEDDLGG